MAKTLDGMTSAGYATAAGIVAFSTAAGAMFFVRALVWTVIPALLWCLATGLGTTAVGLTVAAAVLAVLEKVRIAKSASILPAGNEQVCLPRRNLAMIVTNGILRPIYDMAPLSKLLSKFAPAFMPTNVATIKAAALKTTHGGLTDDDEVWNLPVHDQAWMDAHPGWNERARRCYDKAFAEGVALFTGRGQGDSNIGPVAKLAGFEYFFNLTESRLALSKVLRDPTLGPRIAKIPVKRPIFVMGMPRTGTTMFHRLLAIDPNTRSPLLKELTSPARRTPADDARRQKNAKIQVFKMNAFLPHLQAIHRISHDHPEECHYAMALDCPINWPNYRAAMAAYTSATEGEPNAMAWDYVPAYRNYKSVLQTLTFNDAVDAASATSGGAKAKAKTELDEAHRAVCSGEYDEMMHDKPKRWVLKSPLHIGHVAELAEVFPDAIVVWMHRSCKSSVPSWASLTRAVDDLIEDDVQDLHSLGQEVLRYTRWSVKRAISALDELEANGSGVTAHHVKYDELIKDPKEQVRRLYGAIGLEFTPEYSKLLDEYLANDAAERSKIQGKGAKAHGGYSPATFGLTEQEILARDDDEAIALGADYEARFLS